MSPTDQVQVSHTPAPWFVSVWDNGRVSIDVNRDDEPEPIAEIVQGEPDDVAAANARLIAAAPETTEELEALIEFCEALLDGKAGAVEDIESRLPYAKKALGKARGKS